MLAMADGHQVEQTFASELKNQEAALLAVALLRIPVGSRPTSAHPVR